MFKTLRRLLIVLWLLIVLGAGMAAERRWDLYKHGIRLGGDLAGLIQTVVNYPKDRDKISVRMTGSVVKVLPGGTVQVEDAAGYAYNLKLAGIATPIDGARRTRIHLSKHSPRKRAKAMLEDLTLNKEAEIAATHINPNRTGVALLEIEGQDVNAELVRTGWAQVDRRNLQLLPTRDQLRLLKAEREAKEAGLGIWRPSSDRSDRSDGSDRSDRSDGSDGSDQSDSSG